MWFFSDTTFTQIFFYEMQKGGKYPPFYKTAIFRYSKIYLAGRQRLNSELDFGKTPLDLVRISSIT